MTGDGQLLLMIVGMHLLGLVGVAVLMIYAFRQGPGESEWRQESGPDDGWGNKPLGPSERGDRPRGGIPLPDAEPAAIRLRDHRKLPELLPRPTRRPAREPERTPAREPV